MAHPGGERRVRIIAGAIIGEGHEGAALRHNHRAVVDAEIARMHLVDRDVFGRSQVWLGEGVPTGGFQVTVGQVKTNSTTGPPCR